MPDAIKPLLRKIASPSLSIGAIIHHVCDQTGFSVGDLLSPRHGPAKARHIAMWIAREATGASFPKIARAFAGRDHTTILYGCRRVDNDPAIRAEAVRILEAMA